MKSIYASLDIYLCEWVTIFGKRKGKGEAERGAGEGVYPVRWILAAEVERLEDENGPCAVWMSSGERGRQEYRLMCKRPVKADRLKIVSRRHL